MECNEKACKVIIVSDVNDRMYNHFEFLARVNVNAANITIYYQTKDIGSFIRLLAIKCLWMIYRIVGKMITRAS